MDAPNVVLMKQRVHRKKKKHTREQRKRKKKKRDLCIVFVRERERINFIQANAIPFKEFR